MMTMMTGISNWLISYRPAVQILAAIVLMVCGAGCMIPSEKIKTWATAAIPYVALGAGIIYCSTNLASEFASNFVFEGAAYLLF